MRTPKKLLTFDESKLSIDHEHNLSLQNIIDNEICQRSDSNFALDAIISNNKMHFTFIFIIIYVLNGLKIIVARRS